MTRAETVIEATEFYGAELRRRCDMIGDGITRDDEISIQAEAAKEAKDDFDLPYSVHLFLDNALKKEDLKDVRKYASKFAKGIMTSDQFGDMLWFFEEMAECDWGFIFIETPLGYYDGNGNSPIAVEDDNSESGQYDAAVDTMREIATRKSAYRPKPKRTKKKNPSATIPDQSEKNHDPAQVEVFF